MALTTLCWYSLLLSFVGVMLGSSNIWSERVTMAFLTDGDLREVEFLTCNGITDLIYSITPTLVFLHNTISCLDRFTTGT